MNAGMNLKIKDLDYTDYLKVADLENMFNIFSDDEGRLLYNLNETVYVNSGGAPEYTVTYDSQWTLISYKIYGTTRLAWLLMKLNGVELPEAFRPVKAGTAVKYIP